MKSVNRFHKWLESFTYINQLSFITCCWYLKRLWNALIQKEEKTLTNILKTSSRVGGFMYSKYLSLFCIQIGFRSTVFNFFRVFFMTIKLERTVSLQFSRWTSRYYCFFSHPTLFHQKLEHRYDFYFFWFFS